MACYKLCYGTEEHHRPAPAEVGGDGDRGGGGLAVGGGGPPGGGTTTGGGLLGLGGGQAHGAGAGDPPDGVVPVGPSVHTPKPDKPVALMVVPKKEYMLPVKVKLRPDGSATPKGPNVRRWEVPKMICCKMRPKLSDMDVRVSPGSKLNVMSALLPSGEPRTDDARPA
jgi:hypothetical protein